LFLAEEVEVSRLAAVAVLVVCYLAQGNPLQKFLTPLPLVLVVLQLLAARLVFLGTTAQTHLLDR
jgi:hypothetical protein